MPCQARIDAPHHASYHYPWNRIKNKAPLFLPAYVLTGEGLSAQGSETD